MVKGDKAGEPQEAAPSRGRARPIDYPAIQGVSRIARVVMVQTIAFSAQRLPAHEARAMRGRPYDESIEYWASRIAPMEPAELVALIRMDYKRARANEMAVRIQATCVVGYDLAQEAGESRSEDALDQFAEVNGVYNAWPFLRELVATSALRLGISDVLLPLWQPPATLPTKGKPSKITHQRSR